MTGALNSFASGYRMAWFRRELAPFPGREITTLRIVVTVMLVIIISLTLRVPQLFFSAFFVFFVTKENRSLTLITGVVMIVGATIAIAISLFLFRYTFDYPELRVPVLAGLVFTGMFLSRVFFIGPLGFVVGFIGALAQTTAEGARDTEALVRGLLWLWVSLVYPIVLTVIINQVLLPVHPWDALVRALRARLEAAAITLRRVIEEGHAGGRTNPRLLDLATRGSSALCVLLGYAEAADPALKARHASLTSAIAASEFLVGATASLELRPKIAISGDDRICAGALLVEIVRLQNALGRPHPELPPYESPGISAPLPHLRELQAATRDFHTSLSGQHHSEPAPATGPARRALFVADAFTNPAHVRFALKVTLASMVCYFIYAALDWQGLSTSFLTCCFIALGNTGSSMRKGWLRLIGCCTGGLLGLLCIIFLVPHMESIASLVLLAAAGTAVAAWVATGSGRISYAGLQGAFAFYLCIFQGFAPDTNFTTIRDRVIGIVIGIVASSAIFHNIWPEHAIDGLRVTLARVLRNVSRLLLLPPAEGSPAATKAELHKVRGEIAHDLDSSLFLSEVMIFEDAGERLPAGFSPARLEQLVASTQALSLMTAVLLGQTKLEEWEQLEKPVQDAELALRASAAGQLQQIAALVENHPLPAPADLPSRFATWSRTLPPFTPNDRPRLIRRVIEQIREMS